MNTVQSTFDALSAALSYPREDHLEELTRSPERIRAGDFQDREAQASAAEHLEAFVRNTKGLSPGEFEELYTRTFDINPVCSLEVGWHLFGETYERGAFLVQMREVLRRCSVEESTELPDHLTLVLAAFGRMTLSEAEEFASQRLVKAVNKMLEGFAGKENPYEHILRAVSILISQRAAAHVGA